MHSSLDADLGRLTTAFDPTGLLCAFLAATGDRLVILDADAHVCHCGAGVAAMLACHPAVLLGQPLTHWCPPETTEQQQAWEACRTGGETHALPLTLCRQDGVRLPITWITTPIRATHGGRPGTLCLALDPGTPLNAARTAGAGPAGVEARLTEELNHRVRNNLAMISALLEMEMLHAPPGERFRFQISLARIRTMALVYDLFLQDRGHLVEVATLIRGIIDMTLALLEHTGVAITVQSLQPAYVASREATYLGLALTEIAAHLVHCATEHGHLAPPTITIEGTDGEVVIAVASMSCRSDPECRRLSGLSREILLGLVERSLGGRITLHDSAPFRAVIHCPTATARFE